MFNLILWQERERVPLVRDVIRRIQFAEDADAALSTFKKAFVLPVDILGTFAMTSFRCRFTFFFS